MVRLSASFVISCMITAQLQREGLCLEDQEDNRVNMSSKDEKILKAHDVNNDGTIASKELGSILAALGRPSDTENPRKKV